MPTCMGRNTKDKNGERRTARLPGYWTRSELGHIPGHAEREGLTAGELVRQVVEASGITRPAQKPAQSVESVGSTSIDYTWCSSAAYAKVEFPPDPDLAKPAHIGTDPAQTGAETSATEAGVEPASTVPALSRANLTCAPIPGADCVATLATSTTPAASSGLVRALDGAHGAEK